MTRHPVSGRDITDHVGRCHALGKAQFVSRGAAKRYSKRYPALDKRAYPCEHCGYFHLGGTYGLTRDQHRDIQARKLTA